jgi:hypothetical protein
MNVLLWILQILLALHTLMGGFWKLANSERAVPTLQAIPHAGWLALGVVELFCVVCLILPLFSKRLGILAPVAATYIAAEMLLFSGLHLSSGATNHGSMVYWLVVAAVCAFIAYGRFVLRPLKPVQAAA